MVEQKEQEKVLRDVVCLPLAQLSPQLQVVERVMAEAKQGLGGLLPLNLYHLDHLVAPGSG